MVSELAGRRTNHSGAPVLEREAAGAAAGVGAAAVTGAVAVAEGLLAQPTKVRAAIAKIASFIVAFQLEFKN
jgi:hypothetical protein